MSNCPHCHAPVPAPKPGASRPLNFCQACGKSLSGGAVKSSPAKTLMWSGGPIPGLPVKPGAPEAAPAPAPAAEVKRRTATGDIGVAATIVPPAPDSMPVNPRAPQKTVIGSGASYPIPGVASASMSPPAPADVDVSMEEAPAAPEPTAPAGPPAGGGAASPREADESVPEWAGASPSVGTGTKVLDKPGNGPNKLLIAGVAGGGLVAVAVVVGLLMGGKPAPTKIQAAAPVPAAESPKPVAVPPPANPAPVAAQPAKPAEAKPEAPAPEKAAPPAAQPVVAAKPVEAVVPAADKAKVDRRPAPAPAAERPSAFDEPAPQKKAVEAAAPSGGDKVQLAAEAFQRGNAKLLSGALPEAIAAFSEAIKLNPKDAQSERGLGLAYAESGNTAQAVRHLKLYLKAVPGAPDRALIEKRIGQLSGR